VRSVLVLEYFERGTVAKLPLFLLLGVMGNTEAYANQEAIGAAFPVADVSKVKIGGKGGKRQRIESEIVSLST